MNEVRATKSQVACTSGAAMVLHPADCSPQRYHVTHTTQHHTRNEMGRHRILRVGILRLVWETGSGCPHLRCCNPWDCIDLISLALSTAEAYFIAPKWRTKPHSTRSGFVLAGQDRQIIAGHRVKQPRCSAAWRGAASPTSSLPTVTIFVSPLSNAQYGTTWIQA